METLNPTRLAELGEKLYQERFKDQYAPEHTGEVLAIDVESESAYLGKSALEALLAGEAAHRGGFFHVVKIGGPGVYQMGFGRSTSRDRIVR
jgi:hypothetical protein